MDSKTSRGILRDIHILYALGSMGGLTDCELLERFLARGDSDAEDAFAALVARHGPMVLGVCRRMLPASHDAEDAFQATFLVLARRAASIARRERVATWLYSVAVRTAQVARRRFARQRAAERRLMNETSKAEPKPTEDREDLLPILDEELNRLPHRFRVALVSCEIEGQSRREAARQLGIPEGTLSAHLARGRKLLRERLQRRGVSLGVGPLAGLAGPLVENAVPEQLIGPTVRAALLDSSAAGATAVVTTAVSSLAERVLKMMFLARLSLVVAALMTAAAGYDDSGRAWLDPAGRGIPRKPIRRGPVRWTRPALPGIDTAIPFPMARWRGWGAVRFRGGDRVGERHALFVRWPDPPHGQPGLPRCASGRRRPAGSSIKFSRVPARPRAMSASPSRPMASGSPSPAWNAPPATSLGTIRSVSSWTRRPGRN